MTMSTRQRRKGCEKFHVRERGSTVANVVFPLHVTHTLLPARVFVWYSYIRTRSFAYDVCLCTCVCAYVRGCVCATKFSTLFSRSLPPPSNSYIRIEAYASPLSFSQLFSLCLSFCELTFIRFCLSLFRSWRCRSNATRVTFIPPRNAAHLHDESILSGLVRHWEPSVVLHSVRPPFTLSRHIRIPSSLIRQRRI